MFRFLSLLLVVFIFSCVNDPSNTDPAIDMPNAAQVSYQKPHRPQYHFTPPAAWMNDPNGMVYLDGEYHLFYQHYPDSTVWGPMHWGHAVSPDLVHWAHLPIALYPDSLGYIFSGSAVVDHQNTSGFGQNGQPPLIAIFTHHDPVGERSGRDDFQFQSIAYSTDKGRTWTKYAGNPVIPNTIPIRDFRDPKVIWDTARAEWLMVFAAKDRVQFWTSPNLKDWTYKSDFGDDVGAHGGVWECPDIFPLSVEGSDAQKWVLLSSINPGGPNGGSATQYFVGEWNGERFVLDPTFRKAVPKGEAVWLDYGRDNYAGVTWSDAPDDRRIFLGWMSNWDYAQVVPTEAWRSAMTLPRTLTLHRSDAGYRLHSAPVKELERLRGPSVGLGKRTVRDTLDLNLQLSAALPLLEADLVVELPNAPTTFAIELSNDAGDMYRIGYSSANNSYFSDRRRAGAAGFSEKFAANVHQAPRTERSATVPLHLFFDMSSVELFTKGDVALTDIYFPQQPYNRIRMVVDGAPVTLAQASFFPLESIWD